MDVLMDRLTQRAEYKEEHQAIQDAFNAQTRSGEYLGVQLPIDQEMANIINNSTTLIKQGLQQQLPSKKDKYTTINKSHKLLVDFIRL